MWMTLSLFGAPQQFYCATPDVYDIYGLDTPPDGYMWAQLDADAPYRLWPKLDTPGHEYGPLAKRPVRFFYRKKAKKVLGAG